MMPLIICASSIAAAGAPLGMSAKAHGKIVFDKWCGGCHRPLLSGEEGVAGTSTLERAYRGSKPAALEERTDLNADYIELIVRRGIQSMPPTRKTEVSDADLDSLAAYLVAAK